MTWMTHRHLPEYSGNFDLASEWRNGADDEPAHVHWG
jgi:hypothetical protein